MKFIKDTISDLQSNNQKRKGRVLFNLLNKEDENTGKSMNGCGAEPYDNKEGEDINHRLSVSDVCPPTGI